MTYVSERCLIELAKQSLIGCEKLNKLEFYDKYILRKQHMVNFENGMHNSNRSCEYVN